MTDAWHPQVNGVTRTLERTRDELTRRGHGVSILAPHHFTGFPCPTEPDIRVAVPRPGRLSRAIDDFAPDAVHVATEGPLGWRARAYCRHRGVPFTTSFCTRWPEYLKGRIGMPAWLTYRLMRRFHGAAARTTVATPGLMDELRERGFENLVPWTRGVDLDRFRPRPDERTARSRPVYLYVGRVAAEKNLDAFLGLDLDGEKVVVGGGPALEGLKRRFPGAHFLGPRHDEALARVYADADVFVFPSRTDTFGLVVLEALASGLPVAAYPVRGPKDILEGTGAGVLDEDLRAAVLAAGSIPPDACRRAAERYSWSRSADQLIAALAPFGVIDAFPRTGGVRTRVA